MGNISLQHVLKKKKATCRLTGHSQIYMCATMKGHKGCSWKKRAHQKPFSIGVILNWVNVYFRECRLSLLVGLNWSIPVMDVLRHVEMVLVFIGKYCPLSQLSKTTFSRWINTNKVIIFMI